MTIETPAPTTVVLDAILSRDDLLDALTFTGVSVSSRPPVPILGGVRLDASADQITLSTTDFESFAWQTIRAPGVTPASVVLPHASLVKIVKTLPKSSHVVTLNVTGGHAVVGDGQTTFKVPVMDLDAFPSRPTGAWFKVVEMSGKAFHETITRVTVAASTDLTVPILTNVAFKAARDHVNILATDRYRLTAQRVDQCPDVDRTVLLPSKLLTAAAALFKSSPVVTLRSDRHRRDATPVGFFSTLSDGQRGITIGENEGEYPAVERLFPDEGQTPTTVDLDTADTLAAIKQVDVALNRGEPVRLDLGDPVLVQAGNGDLSAERPLKVSAVQGQQEADAVAFNPKFFTDALKACGTTVRMAVNHPNKPVLFTSTDAPGFRYLLVPIRFAR